MGFWILNRSEKMTGTNHLARPVRQPLDQAGFIEAEGPLHLLSDWVKPVFIHYRIAAERLQPHVPYELDLWDDTAWVSLVAFTMRDMRPAFGGALGRFLFLPFRTQRFLNVRTYVRVGDERGIHFLTEWISDWINSRFGPRIYGLPYRYGRMDYLHREGAVQGRVSSGSGQLLFTGSVAVGEFTRCSAGTVSEFLMERYAAFNAVAGRQRFFRVWHEPWMQSEAEIEITSDSLLASAFPWWQHAYYHSANFSEGAIDVMMGRPRRLLRSGSP